MKCYTFGIGAAIIEGLIELLLLLPFLLCFVC
jgi:hypothetical protein